MKSRCREFTDRAIAATVAAIEIYNKPDFPYRAETFCILAINGWELLLKAKWLHENNNKIRSLYVREPYQKKDGTPSKRLRIKRTHSGNPFTYSLGSLARKLVEQKHLDQTALKNIEVLLELRNSSVHFYNQSGTVLATQLQELGAASLKNFVLAMKDWFARDLSEFNFYLMPLSFVSLPQRTDAIILNREEQKFLEYLEQLKTQTDESGSKYVFMVNIEVKFTRSRVKGAPEVQITNNPDATEIRLSEDQIRERYPWDYERLGEECRKRYPDFKRNGKYHGIRQSLSEDEKFIHVRYLNPSNPKSSKQSFYNPNILQEMDKHYSKK